MPIQSGINMNRVWKGYISGLSLFPGSIAGSKKYFKSFPLCDFIEEHTRVINMIQEKKGLIQSKN